MARQNDSADQEYRSEEQTNVSVLERECMNSTARIYLSDVNCFSQLHRASAVCWFIEVNPFDKNLSRNIWRDKYERMVSEYGLASTSSVKDFLWQKY